MILFNAVADANIIPKFHKKTKGKIKLNILNSYHYAKGQIYKLTKVYRKMIGLLYLDSGAFSVSTGKSRMTISEYSKYINMFGDLFDEVFTLDDDFEDPFHNFCNQAFLVRHRAKKFKRPIPAIHYEKDPFKELEIYRNLGHDYIALGSNSSKKYLDDFFKKVKDKYPDLKIHMFGKLDRKILSNHKPYSADAASWTISAVYSRFYYLDPIDKKEWIIYTGRKDKTPKGKSIKHFQEFDHINELKDFLLKEFNYELKDLISSKTAREIVNLYFYSQLESLINNSQL